MFHFSVDSFDETNINKQQLLMLIEQHAAIARRVVKCESYYEGHHAIMKRKKEKGVPNNKVMCNHAKDICDTAVGYFMGNPITYKSKDGEDIEDLTAAFSEAHVDDVDADNAKTASKCGVAYEYVYANKDGIPVSKNLSSASSFIVLDNTIEENELFAVYYYEQRDDIKQRINYKATVATEHYIYDLLIIGDGSAAQVTDEMPKEHYFGAVPVIEYQNNMEGIGDYEQEMSLIDAYNNLMSDRVDDKDAFVDAILVVYGALLGDTEEEADEAVEKLKYKKMLEMPADARAEYLTRQLDENGVEVLRKAIKEDIYTFAHIPNLSDENFAGNSSGVAMEYKLLGLEMVTKIKERYYKRGLRKRIRLYCNFLRLRSKSVDPHSVEAIFSRSLPKNLLELSQIIANLSGKVSDETLIGQLPFVANAAKELELVEEQAKAEADRQRSVFDIRPNTPEALEDEE